MSFFHLESPDKRRARGKGVYGPLKQDIPVQKELLHNDLNGILHLLQCMVEKRETGAFSVI